MRLRRLVCRGYRNLVDHELETPPTGFHIEVEVEAATARSVATTYSGRKKRITADGEEIGRLAGRGE